jgi:pimeloyl-ACP methyl ester carboxylesterase
MERRRGLELRKIRQLQGGRLSLIFGKLNPRIAEEIKKLGCARVTVEIINNSGHYVADERPAQVTALIERFAAKY